MKSFNIKKNNVKKEVFKKKRPSQEIIACFHYTCTCIGFLN